MPITTAERAAQDAVSALTTSEKSGHSLVMAVDEIVIQAGGWSEYIADKILKLLVAAIRAGAPMGAAMRDAYNKSCEAAERFTTFTNDHPILCTVVALGILWILAPVVMSALGFAEEGIMAGRSIQSKKSIA